MLYLLQVYLLVTVAVTVLIGAVTGLTYAVVAFVVMLRRMIRPTVQFLNRVFPRADAALRTTFKYLS